MASPMSSKNEVFKLQQEDLRFLTDNFSASNHIAKAQYCELYNGKIPQGWKGLEARDVTVKVWVKVAEMNEKYSIEASYSDLLENFNFEINLLKHHNASPCPNLPMLMAFCWEDDNEMLGVVYDIKSTNTLRNLVDKGEFKWLDRIKVAVRLAGFLEFLHGYQPRYLVRDLSAAHIMLDQDLNPVLFKYFMLTGKVIGETDVMPFLQNRFHFGSYGYIDTEYVMTGIWREATDIFALGVILSELLLKRTVDHRRDPKTGAWYYLQLEVIRLYPLKRSRFSLKQREYSFVDKSFEEDPEFDVHDGQKISKLARLCADEDWRIRPTSKDVVRKLRELHVVREHGQVFGA